MPTGTGETTYTRAAVDKAAKTFDDAAQSESIRSIGPAFDADVLALVNRMTGYFGPVVLYFLALVDDVAQGTTLSMTDEYKQDRQRAFDAIGRWTVLLNSAIRQSRRLSWPIVIILCLVIYIALIETASLVLDVVRMVSAQ